MTKRRSLSSLARLRIFERDKSLCHICGQSIQVGEKWEAEHRIPLALGGADDETNMSPAHVKCHAGKSTDDMARIAKSKRMKARHIGAKKPSPFRKPPPGARYDWRRKRYVFTEAAK